MSPREQAQLDALLAKMKSSASGAATPGVDGDGKLTSSGDADEEPELEDYDSPEDDDLLGKTEPVPVEDYSSTPRHRPPPLALYFITRSPTWLP